MARIIEMGLNCEKGPTSEPCCECSYCQRIINRKGTLAVMEINAAAMLKDDLKRLLSEFDAYGFGMLEGHKKSVLLIDECHGLTDDQASLFLTHTEDVHEDNYFIFCTTDPDKFLVTLRNRCTIQLPFEKLGDQEILKLLSDICQQEDLNYDTKTLKGIVKESKGMPRVAVSRLQQTYFAGKLTKKRILTLKGKNNIIAIAPHAPKDDDYTNIIVKTMFKELRCYAVINEKYRKKEVDLNKIKRIQDNGIESEFLEPIKNFKDAVAANNLDPLIVLVHGIEDSNMDTWGGKNAKILIGYGQGESGDKTKPHRPTLDKSNLNKLEASLASAKLNSKPAPSDSDYCARDKNNLNQLFNLKSSVSWGQLGSGHTKQLTLQIKWPKTVSKIALIDQFFP